MKTHFKDFTNTHPTKVYEEIDHVIMDHQGIYEPPRMMLFENYWCNTMFSGFANQSCQQFLQNIGQMIGEPVNVGHRFIHSLQDLQYYLKTPGGVLWDVSENFSIAYFGFHGNHTGFPLPNSHISKNDILELFRGFDDFPTVLYFNSCSLFQDDDQFGYDLLTCGKGIKAVVGYKKIVPFTIGMIIDLIFVSTFFMYKVGDPFTDIQSIYNCVVTDFPYAQQLGYTLYC